MLENKMHRVYSPTKNVNESPTENVNESIGENKFTSNAFDRQIGNISARCKTLRLYLNNCHTL